MTQKENKELQSCREALIADLENIALTAQQASQCNPEQFCEYAYNAIGEIINKLNQQAYQSRPQDGEIQRMRKLLGDPRDSAVSVAINPFEAASKQLEGASKVRVNPLNIMERLEGIIASIEKGEYQNTLIADGLNLFKECKETLSRPHKDCGELMKGLNHLEELIEFIKEGEPNEELDTVLLRIKTMQGLALTNINPQTKEK